MSAPQLPDLKTIQLSFEKGVLTIALNRPDRKNAFNEEMYNDLISALKYADNEEQVVLAVLTGKGNFYSSGNDLGNFDLSKLNGTPEEMSKGAGILLTRFVEAFIDFSKPLIAAVNGPAIGVAATTLALCDVVYGSESSTYNTPFASLGQSPEGLSSILFPQLMGISKANEVLMFGKKLNAKEAEARNLISEVIPDEKFRQVVHARALEYAKLPPNTLREIKKIVRQQKRKLYKETNQAEVELLNKLWISEECLMAVMNFMQQSQGKRRSKL